MSVYITDIEKNENGFYVVKVINQDTGEVIITQDINPKTGEPIQSEDEANEVLQILLQSLSLPTDIDVGGNIPYLDINVLVYDEEKKEWIKSPIIQTNQNIKITFELYIKDNKTGEKQRLPLNGKYIVPYLMTLGKFKDVYGDKFFDKFIYFMEHNSVVPLDINKEEIYNQDLNVFAGNVLVDVKDGYGEIIFKVPKSGFYKVVPDYVINAETLQEVYPKPKTESEIIFIVVDRPLNLEENVETETNEETDINTN